MGGYNNQCDTSILWVSVGFRLVCTANLQNYQYRTVNTELSVGVIRNCLSTEPQNFLQNYRHNVYKSTGQQIVVGVVLLDEYPRFGFGMDYVTYQS